MFKKSHTPTITSFNAFGATFAYCTNSAYNAYSSLSLISFLFIIFRTCNVMQWTLYGLNGSVVSDVMIVCFLKMVYYRPKHIAELLVNEK